MSPRLGPGVLYVIFSLVCVLGFFCLLKLFFSLGSPFCVFNISRPLAVLFSSARCAQLSRVGSVPGDEVRGLGLGEGISCSPDEGLTQPCILPCIPPPVSPPRDLLFQTKKGNAGCARILPCATGITPPPPCPVPPLPLSPF